MKVEQGCWRPATGWDVLPACTPGFEAQLVLAFGSRALLASGEPLAALRARHPGVILAGCSTAGEICDTVVCDDTLVATGIRFDRVTVHAHIETTGSAGETGAAARRLADALAGHGLRHVLVFSDGLHVSGSELVRGMAAALPPGVAVTGGLSADGDRFQETLVVCGERVVSGGLVGIGFYGEALEVAHASRGGWEPFGPDRMVTRSERNLLLELDGEPALALYRRYLGPHAAGLPATGLHSPLGIRLPHEPRTVVRTILGIDEARGGLLFAGDIPTGIPARLMRGRPGDLLDGALGAGEACRAGSAGGPDLALLVSGVGRRLVLGRRTEEEVERVRSALGTRPVLAGFYSYGEISPFEPGCASTLHNQTMTITTFSEGMPGPG